MWPNFVCRTRVVLFFLLKFTVIQRTTSSINDVSQQVFGDNRDGVIAAFGDFNADKATDIFVISNDGKALIVLMASTDLLNNGPFTPKVLLPDSTANGTIITAVVPADFDGDSQMDVLLMRKRAGDFTGSEVTVEIRWGSAEKNALDAVSYIEDKFRDQPAVIDANGDILPDLLGENSTGHRNYWIFNSSRNYHVEGVPGQSLSPLLVPQSSAFLDINNDLTADLCVVSVVNDGLQVEVWLNQEGTLTWNATIPGPPELKPVGDRVIGQATFADMDEDHSMDILLPACLDKACKESVIFVWSSNKWHQLPVSFKSGDTTWGFVAPDAGPLPQLSLPVSLRTGDLNLDGYPDSVAVLTYKSGTNTSTAAFLLINEACRGNCSFSRTLQVGFGNPLLPASQPAPILATFFDLLEDGVLDLLLTSYDQKNARLHAMKQQFAEDACFMKVMVTSGLCLDNCPGGHQPYGVNQMGPTIRFETTTSNGGTQIGVASQLSQSAYFALQLPFVVFGLGQMPNFVDQLQVGMPYGKGELPRSQTWTSIIPNTQLVVIPYPLHDPRSWTNKLFVTPSRLVLLTGAALLGTCAFIAIIIGLLHWCDRVEDKREKLQDSHRFHFDAM